MCDCIAVINDELRKRNTKLAFGFSFSDGEMKLHSIIIQTETTTPGKRRIKPPLVLASHCPFCGDKLTCS